MDKKIKTIITILEKKQTFNNKEIEEISEYINILFKEYVELNLLNMSDPNFENNLTDYIFNLLCEQYLHLYGKSMLYRVRIKLNKLIINKKLELYAKIIPRRSQKTSFIREIKQNIDYLSEKLNILLNIPQPAQRTEEWYIFRHNLLTASSIWRVFGTASSKNQLIYEKCKPYSVYGPSPMNSPLHWGQKYEPLSIQLYEKLYNTEITDFGCIGHSKYSFIGASPDGINTMKDNLRYGRMLEIKNIVNRVINGNPKLEYWIQMQLQMETCNLNECDFLETKFTEYESEEAYDIDTMDGLYYRTNDNKLKGRMILFSKEGRFHYEYAPLEISKAAYEEWETNVLNQNKDNEWIKNIFWKLEKYSNVLVLRNKLWFAKAVPLIEEIWNIILKERVTGYEHRAPKRRNNTGTGLLNNKCLINVEKMVTE